MSTYAIGDIQGCYDALRNLLELIRFDPAKDKLWFVGDLVNRGPQSLEVLRFVKSLGERAVTVLGNHDLHLIIVAEGFGTASKEDTFQQVLDAPDCAELIDWLRRQPLLHVEGDYAMVHAGILPKWDIAQAQELAAEAGAMLRGDDYRKFLKKMWGNEPSRWKKSLQGWDRLRIVINAMTRMRFCTEDGALELNAKESKGPLETAPAGCVPWFEVVGRKPLSHTVVFGHWSALGLYCGERLYAIDTGCLWGGNLTALRLEDRALIQLPCPRVVQPDW